MQRKTLILLVMAPSRRPALVAQLELCDAEILAASDCQEARRLLQKRPPVRVVLADENLPDGRWCEVLEAVERNGLDAATVVCAPLADVNLWCDALEQGAYDLLVEPYRTEEVRRIVHGAATTWQRRFAAYR
jgi:DNA-binding NtrC family response regulator